MKAIFRTFILFILIPLTNSILYGIASLFHETTYEEISIIQHQRYIQVTTIMIIGLLVSILILELIYSFTQLKERGVFLLYCIVIIILAVVSYDQFFIRPYEHSLTFISICLILLSRNILKKLFPTMYKRH